MPLRKIMLENQIPVVQLCAEDYEKLAISEYGRIYLMLVEDDGMLYILHSVGVEKTKSGEPKFYWLALNNSITWTSISGTDYFTTIKSALESAIKRGHKVFQHNGDLFKFLKEQMT